MSPKPFRCPAGLQAAMFLVSMLILGAFAPDAAGSLRSRRPAAPWRNYATSECVLLVRLDAPVAMGSRRLERAPVTVVKSWKGPAENSRIVLSAVLAEAATPKGGTHALVLAPSLRDGLVDAASRVVTIIPDDSISAAVSYIDRCAASAGTTDPARLSEMFFEAMLEMAPVEQPVVQELVSSDLAVAGLSPWQQIWHGPSEPFATAALAREGQSWRLAHVVVAQVRASGEPTAENVAQLARLLKEDREFARLQLRQPDLAAPLLAHAPIRDVVADIARDKTDASLAGAAAVALLAAPVR